MATRGGGCNLIKTPMGTEEFASITSVSVARKPNGHFIVDGQVVADTLQCPHCNAHFVYQKGSGTERSFCMLCSRVTCGKEMCMRDCVPFAKKLERIERNGRISSRW